MAHKVKYKGEDYPSLSKCVEANAVDGMSPPTIRYRMKKLGWSLEEALTTPVAENLKRTYTVDGKTYNSLKALADTFDLKHDQIYARASRGFTDHQIAYGKNCITYGGKTYSSKTAIARSFNVSPTDFSRRQKAGYSMEVALGREPEPINSRYAITVEGITYPNAAEMCRKRGIKPVTYRNRISLGWTIDEAAEVVDRVDGRINSTKRTFEVDGESYLGLAALERKFGVDRRTIDYRLKSGHPIEVAIRIKPIPSSTGSRRKAKSYDWDGETYKSLPELASEVGIPISTLRARLEMQKLPLKEAIERGSTRAERIICHGREYGSIADLAKTYKLPYWKVYQRIKCNDFTPEKAVSKEDLRLGSDEKIIVRGIRYRSLQDACDSLHMGVERVKSNREQDADWDDAFNRDWVENPYVVEGETFKSIPAVANRYGTTPATIIGRMDKGFTIEQACGLGNVNFQNLGRFNDTFFERNPEEGKASAQLYFVRLMEKETLVIFEKIGITRDTVAKRFSGKSDYEVEVLNTYNCPLYEAYNLEQKLLSDYSKEFSYNPGEGFEGRTECFLLPDKIVKELSDKIDSLKQGA